MKKMIKNYENRIKDFVLKMVEKPILIKKEKDKYSTSRQEFFASNSNKILYKKGFQFKSYKSDKERINEILKGKESLDKYLLEI
jgi:response regulator RpfG family c-di-GMP phosphodiesterase